MVENGKQIGRRPAARSSAECAGGQKRNRSRATRRTAGGLYLLVGRNGTKSWVYRYRQNGRLRDMGLGLLRLISLAEACEETQVWRKLRHKGGDPIEARRAEKAEKRRAVAKTISFRQCAERYIAAHRVGWKNAKHAAQWPSTLAAYGYPIFGELAVQAVDVALVMKVLERVWQKKPETVSRVRQRVESVLDWATAWKFRQRENPSRWRGHLENLLPAPREIRQVEHHAALPYGEVSAFVAALRAQPGAAARAIELVDIDRDPGLDDSTSLCGLMTAVCRPRLHLAPGFMLVAAQLSGSGSGKGLLDPARFV